MKSIKVNVTENDIKNALRNNPRYCPIASAIKNKFASTLVFVHYWEVIVDGKVFLPSPKAQKFIDDFDMGKKVSPSTFFFKKEK